MKIYVVTIHNCFSNTSYILGTYSTIENALKAINIEFENVGTFTDWDTDHISGTWMYFYNGYTAEIQRTILDDYTDY